MDVDRTPKTALVTGASSGIGLALSKLFAEDHHNLVLVSRNEDKLTKLASELSQAHGIQVRVLSVDLASSDAPLKVADALAGVDIDILVNCAGYGLFGSFSATDAERELKMIQVNVATLTHLTKLFLPGMIERKFGRIMNVASTAAFQPGPLMAVYYATKAYVLSFSEALREELRNSGVTVTTLCPGMTSSGFQAEARMLSSRLMHGSSIMKAETVARKGYRGLMKGKPLVIPGFQNALIAQSVRFLPRSIVATLVHNAQRPTES